MIGFLRFVGLLNAAVWFGAALFFTFGIGPAVFSQEMRGLLGEHNYPFFSGAIAQVLIARYFDLQLICGLMALLHAFTEWLYLGRPLQRFWLGLLVGLFAAGLLGGWVLHPRIKDLHARKYAQSLPAPARVAAAGSLRLWHGVAQGINVLVLVGLGAYLWRVAHPVSTARFVSPIKFQS